MNLPNKKNTTLIEQYLSGEMQEKELFGFEKRLETEPELADLLNLHKEINHYFIHDKVMQEFQDEEKDSVKNERPVKLKKTGFSPLWYAAASISGIIIIATVVLLFYQNASTSHDKIFAEYYKPYEPVSIVRSGESGLNPVLENAFILYEKGDYKGSLSLFNQVLATDKNNILALFYSSIALMETEKFNEAIVKLQIIIDKQDRLFLSHAIWYQGFCYSKINNPKAALRNFEQLLTNEYYKGKSEEIIHCLKR